MRNKEGGKSVIKMSQQNKNRFNDLSSTFTSQLMPKKDDNIFKSVKGLTLNQLEETTNIGVFFTKAEKCSRRSVLKNPLSINTMMMILMIPGLAFV